MKTEITLDIEFDNFNLNKLKTLLNKHNICLDAYITIDKHEDAYWNTLAQDDKTFCYLVENNIESYDFFCYKLFGNKLIDVTNCIDNDYKHQIENKLVHHAMNYLF